MIINNFCNIPNKKHSKNKMRCKWIFLISLNLKTIHNIDSIKSPKFYIIIHTTVNVVKDWIKASSDRMKSILVILYIYDINTLGIVLL